MPKTKVCTKCGKRKKLEAFSPSKDGRHGRAAQCKSCAVLRAQAWYVANRERARESYRTYYAANFARISVQTKAYRLARKEQYRAYGRKHYLANKERFRERVRQARQCPHYRALQAAQQRLNRFINGRGDSVL